MNPTLRGGVREATAAMLIYAVQREFAIDNLLVRTHFIIVMIRWTGLAPWEFESPFPGSITSTFLVDGRAVRPLPGHCRHAHLCGTPYLYINVEWFRGGLVFEAHRLLYHSA